jgi:hypothetical protein
MIKIQQISVIAIIAIGIGALLMSGTGLTQAAFAYPHHHHHHHSSVSIHISQKIHQENNGCVDCENNAINSIGNSGIISNS